MPMVSHERRRMLKSWLGFLAGFAGAAAVAFLIGAADSFPSLTGWLLIAGSFPIGWLVATWLGRQP